MSSNIRSSLPEKKSQLGALAEALSDLDKNPSLSAYSAAARKLKAIEESVTPIRLAILANHTFDISLVLGVECVRRGLKAAFYEAGYDQYRQELLDPFSGLSEFRPDAVLISLHLESTFPGLSAATCASCRPLPDTSEWIAAFRALLFSFRERSTTPVFIHDFIPPALGMDGLLPVSSGESLFDWIMQLNRELRGLTTSIDGFYALEAARLACASGLVGWRDERLWNLARVGINPKKFPILAAYIARSLAALKRPSAKCVVVDLDNTVWGGILGDIGPQGISCAEGDYPANAYAEFQRALLSLRSRGILLAVASKNDPDLVKEAFQTRTDMPLRPEHISAWEVHWNPKPESVQRIAARLNIGLDSLVFLDDNPAEIALMKQTLPQVRACRMPPRPEEFVHFLASLEDFDQLKLSKEDASRAELYALLSRQEEMAAAATDIESFYRSLETVLSPEPAGSSNMDRIVQLLKKTNQFNLTTRRHDASELSARMQSGAELWAFRACDVHGAHGIISVALLEFQNGACHIDTLLMSCRVIGRTLETAILNFLESRALARGASRITGEYIPTSKNGPCRDFYAIHQFQQIDTNAAHTRWSKDLSSSRTACPEWIRIATQEIQPRGQACANN